LSGPRPARTDLDRTFSLSTVFLWTTLVAVVTGVARIAPGAGVLLALLSVPAALRTIGTARHRMRATGESMNTLEKIEVFASSFALVIAIIAAAAAAFVAACTTAAVGSAPIRLIDGSPARVASAIVVIAIGIIGAYLAAKKLIQDNWQKD
jgi:hypothetical protein